MKYVSWFRQVFFVTINRIYAYISGLFHKHSSYDYLSSSGPTLKYMSKRATLTTKGNSWDKAKRNTIKQHIFAKGYTGYTIP